VARERARQCPNAFSQYSVTVQNIFIRHSTHGNMTKPLPGNTAKMSFVALLSN